MTQAAVVALLRAPAADLVAGGGSRLPERIGLQPAVSLAETTPTAYVLLQAIGAAPM